MPTDIARKAENRKRESVNGILKRREGEQAEKGAEI
jgi:hypothetical protein